MRRLILGVTLVLVVVGCGGGGGTSGGGNASDPVAAVNNVINAVKNKQYSGIPPMICAAKRDAISKTLDPGLSVGSSAPGLDAQKVRDAMSPSFQDLNVSQVSNDGSKAVVSVTGKMTINVDQGKARDIVKAMLTQGSVVPTDAQVDQMTQAMMGSFAKPTDIDTKIDVVKENGSWLVCSGLTG